MNRYRLSKEEVQLISDFRMLAECERNAILAAASRLAESPEEELPPGVVRLAPVGQHP